MNLTRARDRFRKNVKVRKVSIPEYDSMGNVAKDGAIMAGKTIGGLIVIGIVTGGVSLIMKEIKQGQTAMTEALTANIKKVAYAMNQE